MTINYSESNAVLKEIVTIQEVDGLLEWLIANPQATIDLSECVHLHTAALQTLISAGRSIDSWPVNPQLTLWIKPLLKQKAG